MPITKMANVQLKSKFVYWQTVKIQAKWQQQAKQLIGNTVLKVQIVTKAGKEIVYSVEEVDVPKGYQSKANGMNLVNNHTPEVTSVSGQKIWEDENDKDGLRPKEIQVKLLANGKDIGKVAIVSEATSWKYSFEKLAKYEAGKAITYTVEEVAVPKGYTAKVDGMNITNSHTPEKPQTPPSTPEKPKKNILPSTGSQSSFLTLLVGLFTLSGAAYLLKKKA